MDYSKVKRKRFLKFLGLAKTHPRWNTAWIESQDHNLEMTHSMEQPLATFCSFFNFKMFLQQIFFIFSNMVFFRSSAHLHLSVHMASQRGQILLAVFYSINQSINPPTDQSINHLWINQSINRSMDESINQSIEQSTSQSINQSINNVEIWKKMTSKIRTILQFFSLGWMIDFYSYCSSDFCVLSAVLESADFSRPWMASSVCSDTAAPLPWSRSKNSRTFCT